MHIRIPVTNKAIDFDFFPEELKLGLSLLSRVARRKFYFLSILQIFLAPLEIAALASLAATITLGINEFTSLPDSELNFPFLTSLLNFDGVNTESLLIAIIGIYVCTSLAKSLLSAYNNFSIFKLLAAQSARIGYEVNRDLFARGKYLVRFGKSQQNLSASTISLDYLIINYLGTISLIVGDLTTIALICLGLFLLDWMVSVLLILLLICLLLVLHRNVNRRANLLSSQSSQLSADLNRKILDSWLIYREIILSKRADFLIEPTLRIRQVLARNRATLIFLPNLSKYVFEIFLVFTALIVMFTKLLTGGVSDAISSFALIVAASSRLLPATLRFQGSILALKQASGASFYALEYFKRFALLQDKDMDVVRKEMMPIEFTPEVRCINMTFFYPEKSEPAINNVSFSVDCGTLTAIVGPSGSGKSTLVDLITGILEPSSGEMIVSGTTPQIAAHVWPGKIAIVPQEIQIIEGTLADNITLSPGRTHDYAFIEKCLDESGLLSEIRKLPDGINSQVGERGLRLSGGQKQRLGIARALYGKPNLIILDEATSSLDPLTESQITKTIHLRRPDRSIIVVAHRLSTIINADKIIYVRSGTVIAEGNFERLKSIEPDFLEQAKLSGL